MGYDRVLGIYCGGAPAGHSGVGKQSYNTVTCDVACPPLFVIYGYFNQKRVSHHGGDVGWQSDCGWS